MWTLYGVDPSVLRSNIIFFFLKKAVPFYWWIFNRVLTLLRSDCRLPRYENYVFTTKYRVHVILCVLIRVRVKISMSLAVLYTQYFYVQ